MPTSSTCCSTTCDRGSAQNRVCGGYLLFDYINSEGKGLDSEGGVRERIPALEYVRDHFDVVEGYLHLDGRDVSRVVCRRR